MSVRIFGHYVSLPLLLLMLAEAAIHVTAVCLAWAVRFLDSHFHLQSTTGESLWLFPRALLYAPVMLGMMPAFGLYGSELHRRAHSRCPHCQSDRTVRWGAAHGLPRYRCVSCKRTFYHSLYFLAESHEKR